MTKNIPKLDILKLQRAIVDGLEDVKAHDIRVYDTEALSPLFERVLIATGTSNRQTKAIATSVRDKVREAGFPKPRIEGESNGEWIIVDCGAAVAHVMQSEFRRYYNLEELWGDTPVAMATAADRKAAKLSKSSAKSGADFDAIDAPVKKRAPKKAALTPIAETGATAPKPAAKKPAAKKPAAKAASKPAAKAVAKPAAKAPAKSAVAKAPVKAPAKTAGSAVKTAPVKTLVVGEKFVAKKVPAKASAKPAAKSAVKTAVKVPAKKAPVKKAAVKKA